MSEANTSGSGLSDNREKPGLILVDDDPLIIDSLGFVLQEDFQVYAAETRKQARRLLQQMDLIPSLALIDLGLPPKPHNPAEGFSLINELLVFNPAIKILVLSGQSKAANIRHALTLGAVDFVPKPCDALLLKARLQHQLMMLDAERHEKDSGFEAESLVGDSPAMDTLRALITQFADTPFSVLIEGESGSGKELVAQGLHSESSRARYPSLTINCAAFSTELLEAQLFGHAKGAFTGAESARSGFFEDASEGTLFLDEIGDLPIKLQSKLLRVLENGEYYRLGETAPRKSEARIVTATNRDLREEVRAGRFRQDLYHRLSVLTITVPPLRERAGDCMLLLDRFRGMYASSAAPFSLDREAEECLRRYSFPGNVRELRNIVIRLSAKYAGRKVSLKDLEAELEIDIMGPVEGTSAELDEAAEHQMGTPGFRLDDKLEEWEKRYINAALQRSGGNLSKAARFLGINRTTLYGRIQRLGMDID